MKKIPLTKGQYAIIDDEDYEWVSRWKWSFDRYAYRTAKINGKRQSVRLHREIMKPQKGLVVDHINGDKLDNRRVNLRVCASSVNVHNCHTRRKKRRGKYWGVYWDRFRGKWKVMVCKDYARYNIGRYSNEIDAAIAYNKAIKDLYGDGAKLNIIAK